MRSPTYRYNPETCRYEQSKTSFGSVAAYIAAVLITAFVLFVSLLLIHDFLYDSKQEVAFRKENKALKTHAVILTRQLEEVHGKLHTLHKKDEELHNKFFAVTTEPSETKPNTKKQILLYDASTFRDMLLTIEQRSAQLMENVTDANADFDRNLIMDGSAAAKLSSMPTLSPIEGLTTESIMSGFGLRINPFHKGLYEHTGVDIAAARGTSVIAPASGNVVEVKKSDLQAGYGNYIEIDHGQGFVSRFAHLDQINVRVGQKITKGMVIATSGNSGGSISPHLHYEILRNGEPVNPISFILEGVDSRQHEAWVSISKKQNQSLD